MSQSALPCIVCGTSLRNVHDDAENQPDEGVYAIVPGNYGSRVFDPFDGTHLEINVCDPCLVEAGEKGRVLSGRKSRSVVLEDLVIGHEELDTPLVEWHRGLPGYSDQCVLEFEDFEPGAEPLPKRIHINPEALDAAQRLLARSGE